MKIKDLHSLIENPKMNHYIFFEQFMEHLCDTNYKKYLKTLKKIGKFVDEARVGHGMKQVWKN